MRRVLFAVDPVAGGRRRGRELGADLLVTHHPLLLRGVHSVAATTAKGARSSSLIIGDVALYVAHTNADVADPGVCDALAAACGLSDRTTPLPEQDGAGLGRVGELAEPVTLRDFASGWPARCPRPPAASGSPATPRPSSGAVAVGGGAGDDLFDDVRAAGRRRLRHRGPAPPPGAPRRAGGPRRLAVPRRRRALGQRVAVAGRAPATACGTSSASGH